MGSRSFATSVLVTALAAPAMAQAPAKPLTLTEVSRQLESLSEKVGPAIVQIFTTSYAPRDVLVARSADLLPRERSSGSGVIIDADGYIVTNAHVVSGATRVQVELPESRRDEKRSILKPRGRRVGAQVVAIDHETDLAVIKVARRGLPTLPYGDSDELRPGQIVLAFGSPHGFENTVTMGVVSAVARQLEPDDPMIYIQTDAPINPGNSGGALVDVEGRLVGINALIFSQGGGDEGIGFAAPSNIVRNIVDQVRKYGRVRRGDIGVTVQTITPTLASGLSLSQDWGVIIADVDPGGPSDRAGVKTGDLVLRLNGKPMENARQLLVNLYGKPIGEPITLSMLRGTRALEVKVPVAERADDPSRFSDLVRPDVNLVPRFGILALDLDARVRPLLPDLRFDEGVLVAATAEDVHDPAEGTFLPGDVIYFVNGVRVKTLASLREVVNSLKSGDAVVAQIEREGQLRYLAFEVE
jgi:serine protease Do